jgi:hypothetical protein
MSDDTMRIAASITSDWNDHMFSRPGPWQIGGERYDLADDEQYDALGEDVTRTDLPLILVRQGDGQFFEIDLDVMVSPTSAQQRAAHREVLREMDKYAAWLHEHARAARKAAPGE